MARHILHTTIKKSLRERNGSPKRTIRNLVELAENFSVGSQLEFFRTVRSMVIDEVRGAIGPQVPISLRLSTDELIEGGNTLSDCLEYLEYLDDEVDIYDASCALNQTIQYQIDAASLSDGWRSYMARAVREKFGKPTIAMGNIRDPQMAEDILGRGDADMLSISKLIYLFIHKRLPLITIYVIHFCNSSKRRPRLKNNRRTDLSPPGDPV